MKRRTLMRGALGTIGASALISATPSAMAASPTVCPPLACGDSNVVYWARKSGWSGTFPLPANSAPFNMWHTPQYATDGVHGAVLLDKDHVYQVTVKHSANITGTKNTFMYGITELITDDTDPQVPDTVGGVPPFLRAQLTTKTFQQFEGPWRESWLILPEHLAGPTQKRSWVICVGVWPSENNSGTWTLASGWSGPEVLVEDLGPSADFPRGELVQGY